MKRKRSLDDCENLHPAKKSRLEGKRAKTLDLVRNNMTLTSSIFDPSKLNADNLYQAGVHLPSGIFKDIREAEGWSTDSDTGTYQTFSKKQLTVRDYDSEVVQVRMFAKEGQVIGVGCGVEGIVEQFGEEATQLHLAKYVPSDESGLDFKYLPKDGGLLYKGYPFYHWIRRRWNQEYDGRVCDFGIVLKQGQFSEQENKLIVENWKKFCRRNDTKEEELFWLLGNCHHGRTTRGEETKFVEESALIPKLCRGLERRTGRQVIARLRKLYNPAVFQGIDPSRSVGKSDLNLLTFLNAKHGGNPTKIALESGRTVDSVTSSLRKLAVQSYGFEYAQAYIYNVLEHSQIFNMKHIVCKFDEVEDTFREASHDLFIEMTKKIKGSTVNDLWNVFKKLRKQLEYQMGQTKKYKTALTLTLPYRKLKPTTVEAYLMYLDLKLRDATHQKGATVSIPDFHEYQKEYKFYLNSPTPLIDAFKAVHNHYGNMVKKHCPSITPTSNGSTFWKTETERNVIALSLQSTDHIKDLKKDVKAFKKNVMRYLLETKLYEVVNYDFEPHEVVDL
uniref:Integrase catalytic domain-containing protein n=1 Tax=Rhabditophanes sp. KR3021 TaxID=114890 RepID=A0AC35UAC0_9BILA